MFKRFSITIVVAATMGAAAQAQTAQANQQAQADAAAHSQAIAAQQKATYNKAFSACMEGKGYTAK